MDIKNRSQRVLVVDDEPLIRWSLAETLAECGDIVTEAGSGEAALCALITPGTPPDVVLLDYSLPDVQDLSLLAEIRRRSPATRVIVMSAYYTKELAADALALGASRVVGKPIDIHVVPLLVHGTAAASFA